MTEPVRLFVLFVDALARDVWKPALESAAKDRGWDILSGSVDNWAQMTQRCIVLSDDPDWAIVIPASHTAVIMTGPPQWEDQDFPSPATKEALAAMSARFAKASALVASGAVHIKAQTLSVTLPDFGTIQRRDGAVNVAARRASPLDMYKSIPPVPGARAIWPAGSIWFPVGEELDGGTPEMDLTGRGRVLFHGPHLYLTPGLWRASFEVSVDPEGGVPPLRFEWKHGESAAVVHAPINLPGRYSVRLERRWDVVGPSQIAAILEQAVFRGRLELHDCEVSLLEA